MLRFFVIIGFVSVFCYGMIVAIHTPARGQEASLANVKLLTLQKERRDVLKERVESCRVLAVNARGEWSDLYNALDEYYDAELELAPNKELLLELLRQKFENATANESAAKAMETSARVSHAVVLQATARRLDAEIELLREEQP